MSADAELLTKLMATAATVEVLADYGRRIKHEIESDYEWTRDEAAVEAVREAWTERLAELSDASGLG